MHEGKPYNIKIPEFPEKLPEFFKAYVEKSSENTGFWEFLPEFLEIGEKLSFFALSFFGSRQKKACT